MSAARTPKRHMSFLCLVLALLVILSTQARADLFGFAPVSDNSGTSGALAAQLSVEVTPYAENGTDQVLFTFYNDGPLDSGYDVTDPIDGIITGVYFDDGALLGISTIIEAPPDVDFQHPAKGHENFAEGASLEPPFETTAGFSASVQKGKKGVAKGVNSGESLGIVFDLKDGYNFAGVINSIGLGWTDPWHQQSLRIAVRVQAFGEDGGFSGALLHAPTPGALVLGTIGIGMVIVRLRRRILAES